MVGPLQRVHENVTAIFSVLVTGTWLAALFTGQDWWLPFMLVGYIVVVPLLALLFGDEDAISEWWDDSEISLPEETTAREPSSEDEPLRTLRKRYPRGELTDAEFERNVERLLETEADGRTVAERTDIDEISGERIDETDVGGIGQE